MYGLTHRGVFISRQLWTISVSPVVSPRRGVSRRVFSLETHSQQSIRSLSTRSATLTTNHSNSNSTIDANSTETINPKPTQSDPVAPLTQDNRQKSAIERIPTITLLRSYLVWTVTSIPILVDLSPKLISPLLKSKIPGIKSITTMILRNTFFAQFIPGETALECMEKMKELRRRNVGHALNYSAEADTVCQTSQELKIDIMNRMKEIENALEVQGTFEKDMKDEEGWEMGSSAFALKVTGLIDGPILTRASNTLHRLRYLDNPTYGTTVCYPGFPLPVDEEILSPKSTDLSSIRNPNIAVPSMCITEQDEGLREGDLEELRELWRKLDSLAERSRRNKIRLVIDAEETYLQPALDGYTRLLSVKYNRPKKTSDDSVPPVPPPGPVIYGTYQAYLRRQPGLLAECIADSDKHDYALGIKLVRGGYIVKEGKYWKDTTRVGEFAVWSSKDLTDKSYNDSIKSIISNLSRELSTGDDARALGVIFGTHNPDSVDEVIGALRKEGLACPSPETLNGETESRLRLKKEVVGKVGIAQLYGMKEDLSDQVIQAFEPSKMPMSMKFVAYGNLAEVLPFLIRRGIENKSIMGGKGGAAAERRRVGKELRRRLTLGLIG